MGEVGTVTHSDDAYVAIYKLVAPATGGEYNVVVTLSATLPQYCDIIVGVMTFTGVHQTTPLGSFFSASAESVGPAQVSVTDSATGELVYGVFAAEEQAHPVFSGNDVRWLLDPSYGNYHGQCEIGGGSTQAGAASSVVMTWTLGGTEHWAVGAVSIKPATTTGSKWHVRLNSQTGDGTTGALRTEIEGDEEVATTALNDNSWHYVASVLTGTTMADVVHYIDGANDGTTGAGGSTTVNTNTAGDKVTLGARTQSTVQVFEGGILDEIRISNTARSAAWLKAEYYTGNDALLIYENLVRDGDDLTGTPEVDIKYTSWVDTGSYVEVTIGCFDDVVTASNTYAVFIDLGEDETGDYEIAYDNLGTDTTTAKRYNWVSTTWGTGAELSSRITVSGTTITFQLHKTDINELNGDGDFNVIVATGSGTKDLLVSGAYNTDNDPSDASTSWVDFLDSAGDDYKGEGAGDPFPVIPKFSDVVIPVVFVAALFVVVRRKRKKLLNEK